MAEPTSSTGGAAFVALFVGLVGTKYGPLTAVATCALAGAYVSLGEVGTGGKLASVSYLVKYTFAAMATAFAVSYLIERFTHIPAIEVLALVAFTIGWIGGRWGGVLNTVLGAAQKRLGGGKRKS